MCILPLLGSAVVLVVLGWMVSHGLGSIVEQENTRPDDRYDMRSSRIIIED